MNLTSLTSTKTHRYALWFLLQLVTSPKTAHRHVSYHRQSKGRWSRDDPAFPLLVAGLSLGGAFAHAAALAPGFGAALRGTLLAVVAGFLGTGLVVSVAGWSLANGALASSGPGGAGGSEATTTTAAAAAGAPSSAPASSSVPSSSSSRGDASEPVELAFCFDVHSNAFAAAVALPLYCGQVLLLPLLLARPLPSSLPVFAESLLSTALVAASAAGYWYLTFLGYAALPSVGPRRAQLALWPAIVAVGLSPVMALARVNPSRLVLGLLFGQ